MKKYILVLFILTLFQNSTQAQIYDPVDWSWEMNYLDGGKVELIFTPTIDAGWHIYGTRPMSGGPLPTEFIFDSTANELLGGVVESAPISKFDPNFDMQVDMHESGATFRQVIGVVDPGKKISGYLSYMVCNDQMCLPPENVDFSFTVDAGKVGQYEPETNKSEAPESLWTVFLLALGGGLIALVTPCVFPMIPMTVSFFTKQSKTRGEGIRKGLIYGFSIVAIYVLISLPFHIFDSISPDVFNEFSTNPWLNIIFFVIFIIFALSFLGAFEIVLPSSWVNRADKQADKGGLIGIFFMAMVLILVSFSCTGPAIGLLLGSVLSSDGGPTALSIGMLGFGLGLGLPFALFAMFPGWMSSLPKSGGWMNVVKVSLGFLELALAFKFLSNADLVQQWGILEREVFLAIWIAVFLAWALYMFNVFRLPHDSIVDKVSVGRAMTGTLVLAFVIYLIPGLFGAPLKLISGFPPPAFYSEAPYGQFSPITAGSAGVGRSDSPDGAHPESCPLGLNCFHDYETGLEYAKSVNKPILLDFTGWACVNCRRMEENVWADPSVLDKLRNDFVLVSLYVDERGELPKSEQYISDVTSKEIRTVGNKWSDFQIKHYQSNTQPYYVIVGHDNLKPLNGYAAYDPDIEKFARWLAEGKTAFESLK